MAERTLTPEQLDRADKRRIYRVYEKWPSDARQAYALSTDVKRGQYERVIYLAMGGSATAGDIISDWFLATGGPEVTVFNGVLPKVRLEKTLVVACSTSGMTEETLRLARLLAKRCPGMVTISAGGKLGELAKREGITHVNIPLSLAPRYTLPYSLFASIGVLRSASLLKGRERDVEEAIANMAAMAKQIASDVPTARNPAKQLATVVARSKPRVYACSVAKSLAKRFKTGLNENAKIHAFYDAAPDLFHNEVEAWETMDETFVPIFIRHTFEPPYERRNLKKFIRILEREGLKTCQYSGIGSGSLSQLVTLDYLLDFATYYAAILRRKDPYEIKIIDELKHSR